MGKNIRSTRCLFMGKIIRSNIDFLYVKGNRLFAHKLPIMLLPTGTYYLTYNITFRQLVFGCLGIWHCTYCQEVLTHQDYRFH